MSASDYDDLRAKAEQMLRHTHTDTRRDFIDDQSAYEQVARPEAILALLDDLAAVTAERDQHGPCICDFNPSTTEGPDEFCPRHGRPYEEVVRMGDGLINELRAERDDLRAAVARVTALVEVAEERARQSLHRDFHGNPFVLGPSVADLRAALDPPAPDAPAAEARVRTSGESNGPTDELVSNSVLLPDVEMAARAIEDWLIDNRFPHAYDTAHGVVTAVLALFSEQPTVASVRREAWAEGAEATAEWMANNPSPAGVPTDPPRNPYRTEREGQE